MLLVLNLPPVGLWVRMIAIPHHFLYPVIPVLCEIGVLSCANSIFDVFGMAVFGVFGYVVRKLDREASPPILACILAPMTEQSLCRTLLSAKGDPSIFLMRPIRACLLLTAAPLAAVLHPAIRRGRHEVFQEG